MDNITMQDFLATQLGLEGGKRELLGRGMSGGYDYTPEFKAYAVQNKLATPAYFTDKTPELKQLAFGRMMGKELENKLGSEAEFYDMLNLLSSDGSNMLGISKEQLTRSENLLRGASAEDVKKLQTAMGVTVDGLVGPQTYKALVNYGTAYTEDGVRKNFKFLNKDANPTYKDANKTLINHFTVAEGTEVHVGSDWGNLTLPFGIIPSTIKVDGKVVKGRGLFSKKGEGAKWLAANKDKIDLNTATHTVNGKTYKAEDYTSYGEFAKDVLDGYAAKTKAQLPKGLDEKYLAGFTSAMWNGGFFNATKEAAKELLKPKSQWDMAKIADVGENIRDGNTYSWGLFRRRFDDMNLSLPDDKKFSKVTRELIKNDKGEKTGVRFSVYNKAGSLVKSWDKLNNSTVNGKKRYVKMDIENLDNEINL